MSDEFQEDGADPLLVSMLDVLSCGIGAAIILFLSFSVIGNPEEPVPRIGRFLVAEFVVAPPAVAFRPVIRPPAAPQSNTAGSPLPLLMRKVADDGLVPASGHSIILSGFGRANVRDDDTRPDERRLVVTVLDPLPGMWSIDLVVSDFRDAFAGGAAPEPQIRGIVYSHTNRRPADASCDRATGPDGWCQIDIADRGRSVNASTTVAE